jgi:hypothetical protein
VATIPFGLFHIFQTLPDTSSALCTALAPTTPFSQLAINWTWLVVAAYYSF